jgi:hypothetical protein
LERKRERDKRRKNTGRNGKERETEIKGKKARK